MSKKQLTPQNITTIIVAVIGVLGSVLVAYFSLREHTAPIELAISATQTAEAKQILLSNTLAPTVSFKASASAPTEILPTSTSTFLPEQNFSTNCINAADWTPYTKIVSYAQVNNCWDLTKSGIAAEDGKLSFVVQNDIPQSGSLYMPIPKEGSVRFTVKIDTFVSGETNGNLAFGVGTVNGWLTQGDFLFLRATNLGYYIVYGNSIVTVGKRTIDSYQLGSDVVVAFQFSDLAFDIYVNNSKIVSDIPLSALSSQVFWIGYRLTANSKLVASVSDFDVEK